MGHREATSRGLRGQIDVLGPAAVAPIDRGREGVPGGGIREGASESDLPAFDGVRHAQLDIGGRR